MQIDTGGVCKRREQFSKSPAMFLLARYAFRGKCILFTLHVNQLNLETITFCL